MLPDTIFPEFVPDQVLTSDDLNRLFDYLDEEGRMTRSNLIGIGIVCGLRIKTAADQSSITISKGVGVTSEGYLVRIEIDTTYRAFKAYDSLKEEVYQKFVTVTTRTKTPKFDLWELEEEVGESGVSDLSELGDLNQYIVLLFVELLEEQNKNCDPSSCDDKGIKVTVSIKALLIDKNETGLNSLFGKTGNPINFSPLYSLAELKMPRYDVTGTSLVQSSDILNKYISVLSESFLTRVENTLTVAYTTFAGFLGDTVGVSPFANLKTSFDFIRSLTVKERLIHLQYYYDFISDLLQAYEEFRQLGNTVLSECCPDRALFPRHLVLGEVIPANAELVSSYRHYFIYSPLFEKKNLVLELRSLFSRMEVMKNNLFIPPFFTGDISGRQVKITPGKLGESALSQRPIPYYYKYEPLNHSWNFFKKLRGKEGENLSYHIATGADTFFNSPLKYELESYNFLRIEGHIGKKYTDAIRDITALKTSFRLPFDVIALSTGEADLSKLPESTVSCNIRDLQTSYEIIRREWEAIIGKMIEYLNDNLNMARTIVSDIPDNPNKVNIYLVLLNKAKTFMVEDFKVFISKYDEFMVPIYERIEAQSLAFRNGIIQFLNKEDAERETMVAAEDLVDHFDEVLLSCKKGGFRSIFQQFNSRIDEIYSNMYFKKFVEKHPGIQHKAGVSMGGTFVIVYHKKPDATINGPFTIRGFVRTATGAPTLFSVVHVNDENNNASAMVAADGSFSIVVNVLPAIFRATSFMFFNGIIPLPQNGELLVSSAGQSPVTIMLPSGPVVIEQNDNVFNSLRNGDVIADFYLPYICSSNCTPIQFVINELVNQLPVANAGRDQEIASPQNTTMLDGSASSDPEHKPLKYLWALVSSQQNVIISDVTSAKPAVSNLVEPGEYVFELTVTDEDGALSQTDQVIIKVTAPNQPPTASAGNDHSIQQPANTTVLSGIATDPENKIKSVLWTLESGPTNVTFATPGAATTNVSNLTSTQSPYTFKFTVTDQQDLSASDTVVVTVKPRPNESPVANAGGPLNLLLPVTFAELDGTASSDPDGTISFAWKVTGPPLKIIRKNSSRPIVFDLNEAIDYKLALTVTDNDGLTDTDDLLIQVRGDNRSVCFPLGNIEASLQTFIQVQSTNFQFMLAFPALNEIGGYLRAQRANNISSQPVSVQLSFFGEQRVQVIINNNPTPLVAIILEALGIWQRSLSTIVKNNPNLRTLSLQLYEMLVSFGMYIGCTQPSFTQDRVNPTSLFKSILVEIETLDTPLTKTFDNASLIGLVRLRAILADEIRLIKARNESQQKADYLQQLQQIVVKLDELLAI